MKHSEETKKLFSINRIIYDISKEWLLQQLTGLISPNPYILLEGKLMRMIIDPIK